MIDDAKLIAYVEGELDTPTRAEVEAALSTDPLLAARLARHRQFKNRSARTYDPVALEAGPRRRRAAAGGGTNPSADNVVRLADRRKLARARATKPFVWPAWTPVAASLVVGVTAGVLLSQGGPGPLAARPDGGLAARGDLAKALEHDPAGLAGAARIGFSFRSASGYCRTFQMAQLAGVACKQGSTWLARMTVRPAPQSGDRAAVASPVVLTVAQQMMVGRPLDRAAEDEARARGWKA